MKPTSAAECTGRSWRRVIFTQSAWKAIISTQYVNFQGMVCAQKAAFVRKL